MLVSELVHQYEDRAEFRVEDLGASPKADAFGIDKYPAIFVDDALVARPEDFYSWGGPETGKYLPWNDPASRRELQDDLRRLIDYRLSGGKVVSLPRIENQQRELVLPSIRLTDLSGQPFQLNETRGKPVIVEFWATWCPPCLKTMSWMKNLDSNAADIILIAVESDPDHVREIVEEYAPPGRVVVADQAIIDAFGGIQAVPTMFIANGRGTITRVLYGAPPNLHEQIETELDRLGSSDADSSRNRQDPASGRARINEVDIREDTL